MFLLVLEGLWRKEHQFSDVHVLCVCFSLRTLFFLQKFFSGPTLCSEITRFRQHNGEFGATKSVLSQKGKRCKDVNRCKEVKGADVKGMDGGCAIFLSQLTKYSHSKCLVFV